MTTDTYARIDGTEFKDAERQFRTHLTPGLPAVIRLDGRAFHSYTKGLQRPFDERFVEDMDAVAVELAQQIDGVRLVYTQSDEISLLLTDRADDAVQGFMFGGQVQKLTSISAAIATATLNSCRLGPRRSSTTSACRRWSSRRPRSTCSSRTTILRPATPARPGVRAAPPGMA